jgi:hypothetical protein
VASRAVITLAPPECGRGLSLLKNMLGPGSRRPPIASSGSLSVGYSSRVHGYRRLLSVVDLPSSSDRQESRIDCVICRPPRRTDAPAYRSSMEHYAVFRVGFLICARNGMDLDLQKQARERRALARRTRQMGERLSGAAARARVNRYADVLEKRAAEREARAVEGRAWPPCHPPTRFHQSCGEADATTLRRRPHAPPVAWALTAIPPP